MYESVFYRLGLLFSVFLLLDSNINIPQAQHPNSLAKAGKVCVMGSSESFTSVLHVAQISLPLHQTLKISDLRLTVCK